jgi:malate dehydrogenase (oxaloacetate-decarboxylating)(NADP+)
VWPPRATKSSAIRAKSRRLTARGNLVGVVTNGTAVLGLGAIGPLAAKPVMEGKAVLFKKFAGLDCFDIEIAERDPDKLVDMICALEPTFGGINLEDIKAPECFYIERKCRERMKIPVFHDDQHGTAIIVGAAVLNGLRVVGKEFANVKLVCSGAGAAALACLDLLVELGIRRENIFVSDIKGARSPGTHRGDGRQQGALCAADVRPSPAPPPGRRHLSRLCRAACRASSGSRRCPTSHADPRACRIRSRRSCRTSRRPRVLMIIATGRSDFPNQVNNVLCFPFIFRGALDVGATTINEAMKLACVRAIADLAMIEQSDIVASAYNMSESLSFGPEYLIPKPFDPRLIVMIAPAVAKAAMESGVATHPISDFDAYRAKLTGFVYHSGLLMQPIFTAAKKEPKRIVYAEGEDERVLRAVQVVVDEKLAKPILVGRPAVLARRIERFGLRLKPDVDFEIINPEFDERFRDYWMNYYELTQRKGVSQPYAQIEMRRRHTLIGAMMIHRGDADGMICGTFGTHGLHLHYIDQVIGRRPGATVYAAMNAILLPARTVFIADTYVNADPTAEQIAEIAVMSADEIRRFGITPKAALLSHSSFGTSKHGCAQKMRDALAIIQRRAPDLEVEGEMHGDAALNEAVRRTAFPNSKLAGEANLLIMPTLDAANISFNLLKVASGGGVTLGPILLGVAKPVHILTQSATVRRIVNMTALTVVDSTIDRQAQLVY